MNGCNFKNGFPHSEYYDASDDADEAYKELETMMQDITNLQRNALVAIVVAELRSLRLAFASVELPFPDYLEKDFIQRFEEIDYYLKIHRS